MSKVTFDYSKAGCFVAEHEVEAMKKLAEAAKETLVSKQVQEMISWAGSTFRLIMTKKSLPASKRQQRKFRRILRF